MKDPKHIMRAIDLMQANKVKDELLGGSSRWTTPWPSCTSVFSLVCVCSFLKPFFHGCK